MLVTLAMVVRFSKNLVLFIQEKKLYKPVKFHQNLKDGLDHLTWSDPADSSSDEQHCGWF